MIKGLVFSSKTQIHTLLVVEWEIAGVKLDPCTVTFPATLEMEKADSEVGWAHWKHSK